MSPTGLGTARERAVRSEERGLGFLDLQIRKKMPRRIVKTKKLAMAAMTIWRPLSIVTKKEENCVCVCVCMEKRGFKVGIKEENNRAAINEGFEGGFVEDGSELVFGRKRKAYSVRVNVPYHF